MKHPKLLLLLVLVIPWISVPLLGEKSIKRYVPASVLICLVVRLESVIAKKRKWWWVFERLHPKLTGEFPLIWGGFFVGSLWILKFTYGKFPLYLITNFVVDSIFSFLAEPFLKSIGILSLVRLKKIQLTAIFTFKALLLYIFQMIFDKINPNKDRELN
jgi:hypothetical protein